MTTAASRSSLPSGHSSDVTVIRATATPRSRTFSSPFRSGRVSAAEMDTSASEPDPMDELEALLAGVEDDFDDEMEPGTAPAEPATKAPAKAAPAKRAARAPKKKITPLLDAVVPASAPEPASVPASAPGTAPASAPAPAPGAENVVKQAAASLAPAAAQVAAAAAPVADVVPVATAAPVAAAAAPVASASPLAPATPAAPADPNALRAASAESLDGLELTAAAAPATAGKTVLSPEEAALHTRGAEAASWIGSRVGGAAQAALLEARRDLMRLSRSVNVGEGTMADVRMHQLASAVLLRNGFTLDKRQPGLKTAFSASVGPGGSGPTALFVLEAGAPGDAVHHAEVAALVGAAIAMSAVAPGLGLTVRFIGLPAGKKGIKKLHEAGLFEHGTLVVSAESGERDEVRLGGSGAREWVAQFAAPSKPEAAALPVDPSDAVAMARAALGLLVNRLPQGSSLSASLEDTTLTVGLTSESATFQEPTAERVLSALRGAAESTGAVLRLKDAGEGSGPTGAVAQDAVLVGAFRSCVERRGRDIELSRTAPPSTLAPLADALPTLHVTLGLGEDGTAGGMDSTLMDTAYGLALAAASGCLAGTAR